MEPGHLVACHYCEEMKRGRLVKDRLYPKSTPAERSPMLDIRRGFAYNDQRIKKKGKVLDASGFCEEQKQLIL